MVNQAFRDMIATLLHTPSEQELFFESLQHPLKKSLSINRHKSPDFENDNPDFILSETTFHEFQDTKYVDREDTTIALWKTRQHLTGQFYIQEVAASLPANILKHYLPELSTLNAQPLTILDTCAAPGGKSAQLADYMLTHHIPGVVWWNDVDSKRLISRASNIQRCGLYNTVATKMDASQFGNLYPEFFDAILVDAPCSGEGTGFKSDAAYKRRKEESINKIVGLQWHIISSAVKACKVWGIIIYSTCTLNPYENELQIAHLLEKYGDALEILPIDIKNKSDGTLPLSSYEHIIQNSEFKIQHFLRARPHIHHTGWFFVCVMRKTRSTIKPVQEHITNKKQSKLPIASPYQYDRWFEQQIKKLIIEEFGIDIDLKTFTLIRTKHKVFLAHRHTVSLLEKNIWFQECGIPLLKSTGRSYSLEHEAGLVLGHLATKNMLELTTDQLQSYVEGEDIILDEATKNTPLSSSGATNNYTILTHHGQGIGVGKIINWLLKNKFFKW